MDAYETRRKDWEDLEVTKEELNTLTECLKKEEFRKLLIEYAEEVTDPENRKLYEKEITQLEKERGVDVTFVNPEPGYVIKTSVNGNRKCFLNIGKSDIVARPSSQPSYEQGHRGLQWSIPYTLIPPRDDLDKKNVRCMVFDVVFHPDTIYLASKNARFREIVNNTAMDGVESNFQVKLDRKNLRFPKMNYKGVSQPSVIRKPSEQPAKEQLDLEPEIYQKLMADYDRKREQRAKRLDEKPQRVPPPTVYYQDKPEANQDSNNNYATPKFSIKHQSDIELQDFSTSRDAKMNATVPKRLVVNVDLPLLKTASDASLDVQEHFLSIKSEKPAKYLLDLPLPYRVDPDNGNAKFDPKYKKLVVTLPVIPPTASVSDAREDSGVDSDHESPIPLFDADSVDDCSEQSPSRDSSNELVEKCETVFASPKIEEGSERVGSYGDTALRTSNTETTDVFTNPSIKYSLPAFTCNIYDNQLAITVNVKNVDPNSIRHRILQNNLGIHVTLTSVGAGFYPQHYSFCLKIYKDSVQPESLVIEPWDNNIVFTVALKNTEYLARYYVGIDEEFMEEKDFPTATTFKNQLKELTEMDDGDLDKDQTVEVQTEDDGVVISISSNQCDSDDEDNREDSKQSTKSTQRRQSRRHAKPKARSVSESSGDELSNRIPVFSASVRRTSGSYGTRNARTIVE
nr:protein kintoun isoform X3 [Megalopta genalis]